MTDEQRKFLYRLMGYLCPRVNLYSSQRPVLVSGPFLGGTMFLLALPVGARGAAIAVTMDPDGFAYCEYPGCFGRVSWRKAGYLDTVTRWVIATMRPDQAPAGWPRTAVEMAKSVYFPARVLQEFLSLARKADESRPPAETRSEEDNEQ